ncbi:tRNA(5-methylaminomethyl-2-thiouridylate) methyltransferase [Candidatus Phytoplasma australiense]|uniref:tRNA-specific 2-thiouridylase MnmA n=2 Tax=Phytoplasma australiense TaxID=59748 RepID=MNMA_PHYAS|nr:tRNA 2-thiouridine(34) synthase MnmA [Candidatus Phytoplasma australiense]B1VAX7.1 RecName: Full=tRNA-specific 2-thiouridylase MnmA [Candidatus Phytoplasma australiense]AGL90584.1 putative tRNA [Strawberry lethal yellows phytoplasma (CPA) str. NZSb11]CAM12100.1 tRNA(5-methylaminomethyl-2-thiouridylate) methyltransferase [Candidatus Phytoplasma australiense]
MKKVVVGLSGGVDSAVSALLLKKAGYEVEAVFMRNWDSQLNFDFQGNPTLNDVCPQELDYKDALKVSLQLGIKLHRVNFIEEYWQKVFLYFINAFKNNLTPNPDILCNNEIKFKAFINYATSKLKPQYIAMGHYARLIYDKNQKVSLACPLDKNKDQTYFLSQLKTSQLKNILFPLADLTKKEVRKIALENGLINACKKDSTGICFIGERNFFQFLNNYLPAQKGSIKRLDGTFLTYHKGVIHYTIGQRKNLGLGNFSSGQEPFFVVGKNLKTNTLYVEPNSQHPHLYSDRALIIDVTWRGEKTKTQIQAKMRYRQPNQKVTLNWLDANTLEILYPQKIKAVTPGQICAFYDDDICLGAGVIKEVYFQNQKRLYT